MPPRALVSKRMAAARSAPLAAADRTRARPGSAPLWRALRAVRAAFTVAAYTLLAPSGYVPFAIVCACWQGDALTKARFLQRCSVRGFRFMHWWLRFFRVIAFDWRRVRLTLPPGPCVVIANHPTQLDPTAVMATLGGGCTIVKRSVYRRRLVRPMLAGALHFEGPTLDPLSVSHVIDNAVQRLRSGLHLFVFPEGTRSPEGRLHPFGRLAFEIAARARVPLVSLALRCEPCYLSRETPLLRPPARLPRLSMQVLAIDFPDAGADSRLLKRRAEARYRRWLADGMPAPAAPEVAGAAAASSASTMRPPARA